MSYRCPGATVAFTGYLMNWKLLYRGSHTGSYATVKRKTGSKVPVAVWNIDDKNEEALDLIQIFLRILSFSFHPIFLFTALLLE